MTDDLAHGESHATVRTDRPERYGKQLVSHLGRRNGGEWTPDTRSGWIELAGGRATVTATQAELHLHIVGGVDDLSRLEDVVGRHLVRFGERDELTITWERCPDTTGNVEQTDT
ncbi:DUF2218 domain-containing protein [Rhodococcus opacus]|nr:DUF2218 domain-containing protein [Rhodococcus opacus]RZL82993.1 MAG: DUF2218 domain-containing protein [Rhodococcus sp. (in: high G+C Gram-positive bacteria)]